MYDTLVSFSELQRGSILHICSAVLHFASVQSGGLKEDFIPSSLPTSCWCFFVSHVTAMLRSNDFVAWVLEELCFFCRLLTTTPIVYLALTCEVMEMARSKCADRGRSSL